MLLRFCQREGASVGMDPWADLAAQVQRRKLAYLNALVIPFTPGKTDEEALVTAMRRGYLKGSHHGFKG